MNGSLLRYPHIAEDLTRRELVIGLAAAGLLAACGSDGDAGASGDDPGFPRSVDHELGRTVIKAPPERIGAVTDGAELQTLLALG